MSKISLLSRLHAYPLVLLPPVNCSSRVSPLIVASLMIMTRGTGEADSIYKRIAVWNWAWIPAWRILGRSSSKTTCFKLVGGRSDSRLLSFEYNEGVAAVRDVSGQTAEQLVALSKNTLNLENVDSPIALRHSRIWKPISWARTRTVAVFPVPGGPVKANILYPFLSYHLIRSTTGSLLCTCAACLMSLPQRRRETNHAHRRLSVRVWRDRPALTILCHHRAVQ